MGNDKPCLEIYTEKAPMVNSVAKITKKFFWIFTRLFLNTRMKIISIPKRKPEKLIIS